MVRALMSLAVVFALAAPGLARAQGAYWTTKTVLKDFFKDAERVTFVEVSGADVTRATGEPAARDKYVVFVATTGGRIDGYAVIDDEKGQHQPITFAVKLDAEGRVTRTEIMVYREGYGDEIRESRFRKQYVGKGPKDALRFGDDVVAISGATISSRSMTTAVRRSVAIVDLVRGRKAANTQASLPTPPQG